MFREGLPAIYLVVGFSFAVLVVATLLVEKNAPCHSALHVIAAGAIYLLRRQVKRNKQLLIGIAILWLVCVSIQKICGAVFLYPCVAKTPGGKDIFINRKGKIHTPPLIM